jgi:phosphohistidine phosphatase SixA
MVQIIVARHWEYGQNLDLTEQWENNSIELWLKIKELIWDVSADSVAIVSSTAPRASQTAQKVTEWLWVDTEVIKIKELWDDDNHLWNLEIALQKIRELPTYLVLIIISHLDLVFLIAKWLWYKWEKEKLGYLWKYVFNTEQSSENDEDEQFNEKFQSELININDLNLDNALEIEIRIPVWKLRVIKIVQAIAKAQKEIWQWLLDENMYFIMPDIKPSWDPEKSMKWVYDEEWFFPVIVKTDWESYLEEVIWNSELEYEYKQKYVNQLVWLLAFIRSFDETIDMDNLKIISSKIRTD